MSQGAVGHPAGRVAAAGLAANVAVVALFALHVYEPHIRFDDFDFLTRSRTWSGAFAALWQPMNDHAMPMCRLAAAALMHVVPGQSAVPAAAQMQGPLAVIAGMWLLFLFVRRELGHAVYGVVAMTLWGVTTAYIQAVTWYSASFFILSMDTLMLGLLAAQAWRRTRHWPRLALCAAWCAIAPGWFGGGILAGPWCTVYLLPAWGGDRRGRAVPVGAAPPTRHFRGLLAAAVPTAGSLLFLAVSLPRTAERIVHASHYEGKTVFEAFSLWAGARDTIRTLADNQLLGSVGIYRSAAFGWPVVALIASALVVSGVLWWKVAPNRRLLALGLTIILASDILAYGARADWGYVRTVHTWSRYHVFPHLGLVLVVIGGLPRLLGPRLLPGGVGGGISRRQMVALLALVAVAFACHLPRSVRSHIFFPEQIAVLKRVERVDGYCRAVGISGATAREALGFLPFPLGYAHDNAWDFLGGSPEPGTVSAGRARELLAR